MGLGYFFRKKKMWNPSLDQDPERGEFNVNVCWRTFTWKYTSLSLSINSQIVWIGLHRLKLRSPFHAPTSTSQIYIFNLIEPTNAITSRVPTWMLQGPFILFVCFPCLTFFLFWSSLELQRNNFDWHNVFKDEGG